MSCKTDPATLDHQIIRSALHHAADIDVLSSRFVARWIDPISELEVEFAGSAVGCLSLETASIRGRGELHQLKQVFTAMELKAFNYLINVELGHRLRRVKRDTTGALAASGSGA